MLPNPPKQQRGRYKGKKDFTSTCFRFYPTALKKCRSGFQFNVRCQASGIIYPLFTPVLKY